ncbi:MAG TPA: hypothetical protein VF519_04435 [Mycobacteriales bacterium]|jgi:hypothetical protein
MRRGIVCATSALLGGALLGTASPAGAAPAPVPATVWVAERVSAAATRVEIQAYTTWDSRGGSITMVLAHVDRGRPRPYEAITWDAPNWDGPAVRHGGMTYGCGPGSGCDVLNGSGLSWFGGGVPATAPQPDRVYLAIAAVSQEVTLVDSPGWRLRRTRLRARYATDGAATGADGAGEHVARFTHASLRGGRHGSIATGVAPCRPAHRVGFAREGHGTATLTGGTTSPAFDCGVAAPDVTAASDGPTTWSFDGDVVGLATGATRLVVIDL